jgi:hypothetical protein
MDWIIAFLITICVMIFNAKFLWKKHRQWNALCEDIHKIAASDGGTDIKKQLVELKKLKDEIG